MILPIEGTNLGYPGRAENVKKPCICPGGVLDDSGVAAGRSRPTSGGKERWCAKKATFRGYKTHFAAPFWRHLDVKCASSIAGPQWFGRLKRGDSKMAKPKSSGKKSLSKSALLQAVTEAVGDGTTRKHAKSVLESRQDI